MSNMVEARKWLATIQISWSKHTAYKLNFLLFFVGPTVVFFLIKFNIWSSIFALEGVTNVAGYDRTAMLKYQGWVLIVSFLAQTHSSMQLGEDIRLGRISAFLMYPFGFWKFHAASFLSFQTIQLGVSLLTMALLFSCEIFGMFQLKPLLIGILYCLLVSALWFSFQFALGLFAFWLEESWMIRVIFALTAQFLSGAVIPLEMFPKGLRSALEYSPFPYMTYWPVKWFMGELEAPIYFGVFNLIIWLIVINLVGQFIWKRGLKMYTAAGM
jgi:ABC-2 type transport system permease protein